ncbi:MAG: PAS domain-containing protein [Methanoregula sp.]|nr:PAS domain-containing protein [Methanoregula sp.]
MNDTHDARNMAADKKSYHVLVLEDDEAHIDLIRRGFQLASGMYRVTFAQTVQDARAILAQDPPDLIIADWLLPDGKGIDILPRKDGHVTMPLVIMTSHGNEKLAVDMLKSGAIDYIVKSEFMFKYLPHIAERALREWQNIAERKRVEEELRESEQRFHSLFDNMIEGHALHEIILDGNGQATEYRILDVNAAFENLLNIHRKDVIGKLSCDVYRVSEPPYLNIYALVASSGQAKIFETFFPPMEKHFMISVYSPKKGQFATVFEDITARARAESALRESEQFLDNIVEQIPDMIFVKDAENLRFVRSNKAGEDLLGYSREELLGKNDYDFFPKEQADNFIENDREVLHAHTLKDIPDERIQTRNMGARILHTKKIPLMDEKGLPRYLLGISEDITERKRAEDQINLANRKLALMTDVTFQDIQNKVTALRGYVEINKENVREHQQIIFLEKEEDVLESIHRLIKNTKEYQQMGVDQLRWIPLEPGIRMQASLISGKPDFLLDIDLHGLEIYSDPLIDRVFYNLIDNTVKHSKSFTRMSFSCRETPDGLIVICEDDGIGILPEQKNQIFDRVVGGVGKFGLFFVREFLDMSGITIIENGEPGKGARFEITVPKGMYRFTGA